MSAATTTVTTKRLPLAAGLIGVLTIMAALVGYKASSALGAYAKARASGAMAPKSPLFLGRGLPAAARPLIDAANYLGWVLIALLFGLLLGAAVKALLPRSLLGGALGENALRAQLTAALLGSALMLCSCCSAPVFEGLYQRTRRLGPALGMMIASPALNPAALALTFLLFPARLAVVRLLGALALVVVVAGALGRTRAAASEAAASSCALDRDQASLRDVGRDFLAALRDAAFRTLPAILIGVVISAALAGLLPLGSLPKADGGPLALVAAAALAVPIAMPTFAEIPLGLALLGAGAPASVVAAVLIAGPAINLPSLLTVARAVSPRAALAAGLAVFVVACLAGAAASVA